MKSEVSLPQKCVCMRNGVEIWIPEGEKLQKLEAILGNLQAHMFINWEGRSMNTADMVGIFRPEDMEDRTRRKNGQRLCEYGIWHDKYQECSCARLEADKRATEETAIKYGWQEISDERRQLIIKKIDETRAAFLNRESKPDDDQAKPA